MELDAQQLVNASQKGDTEAAAMLVELYYNRIYAFLRRLTGGEEDASDLTQKTFSRVWRMLPSVSKPASVASWIHKIAYNCYADWRRAQPPHEARPDAWWEALPAHGDAPDVSFSRTDLARDVYAAVDKLPPELRDTVHLHYYQGLSLQETADALGIAGSTVKYRLRQALAQLQIDFANDRSDLNRLSHPRI